MTIRSSERSIRYRSDRTLHIGFVVVLAAAMCRFAAWHGINADTAPALLAGVAFGGLYFLGVVRWPEPGRGQRIWLYTVIASWVVLTYEVESYSWCAVPLFFVTMRVLPPRPAAPVIVLLTVVAAAAQVVLARMPFPYDPSPALAPIAIAVMSTVIYRRLHRGNVERQALIDDLVRTRDALSASERSAGVLQERARLSQEIHDTVAQGLSSVHLLLRAADQEWHTAPDRAHGYVRSAMTMARDNLAETRQFIHDLIPPALDGSSLGDALARLCATTTERVGVKVELRVDGEPYPLGVDAEIALLRVAQGALANVGEHAGAGTAVVTLAYLPEAVRMDVGDDGVGFDPAALGGSPDRGYGLPGIRQRVETLGGVATVESAPGEGTVVAVSLPVKSCCSADGAL